MDTIFQSQIPSLDVTEIKKTIDDRDDYILLDVRTPQEYLKQHIPGSINIPVDTISSRVKHKLPEMDKTIFVYCLSGSRSIIAVEQMIKLGYTNVFNMKNGLLAWRVHQFPLE